MSSNTSTVARIDYFFSLNVHQGETSGHTNSFDDSIYHFEGHTRGLMIPTSFPKTEDIRFKNNLNNLNRHFKDELTRVNDCETDTTDGILSVDRSQTDRPFWRHKSWHHRRFATCLSGPRQGLHHLHQLSCCVASSFYIFTELACCSFLMLKLLKRMFIFFLQDNIRNYAWLVLWKFILKIESEIFSRNLKHKMNWKRWKGMGGNCIK